MLFKGYKFDIRVYACLNQNMELFVFRQVSPNAENRMCGCRRTPTRWTR